MKLLAIKLAVISLTFTIGTAVDPKTVLDYYLLLPEKYFEADREQRVKWMLDPKRGAIIDRRNGYLYAPGDGAQTDIYVCLFKRANKRPIVAVKYYESDTQDYTHLDFYEYKHGSLVPAANDLIPVKVKEEFKYKLPRFGSSIEVSDRHGKRIYDLVWSGTRFKLKRQ